jgi:FdhD protein
MSDPTSDTDLTCWAGDAARPGRDALAREEPLEIRINGVPVAVLMRTPGHDEDLGHGFLITERVVNSPADIASVRHCTNLPDAAAEDNVLLVALREGVALDLERLRRNIYSNSSCGLCGKATIEAAVAVAGPVDDPVRVPHAVLYALPNRLRREQPVFDATGGLHAAGLFDAAGELLAIREDVGRHNAVDKTVGWAVRSGRFPPAGTILMVSGRASFEIVQKAAAARIPVVAAVSAPSSLAVESAQALGITLAGFLRGEGMNVYAGPQRIV